ncbi:ATP-binding protein, partial [Salmonella enterica]|nr:ATP-binding protein [Salmonella enterica]
MAEFAVAARTLLHLGSELITSDEVAIYELIKNAFDSGSSRVSIKFFCPISS